MKALVFPGQGSQYEGMGKELYTNNLKARKIMETANEILGFDILDIMFNGSSEDLKQTKVTQPAIFIDSIASLSDHSEPFDAVAGHSLGEFSALVANEVLTFEDGLKLVNERALAMQEACDTHPSSMAAILGLDDKTVEKICSEIEGIVVPANYNCPGQLVISGETNSVKLACDKLKEAGAKRTVLLPVHGAFHSPLMEPAQDRLNKMIEKINFNKPLKPIYQNFTAKPSLDLNLIKSNLEHQLTGSVKWTQTIENMINDGILNFEEKGPGNTLKGLIKKINPTVNSY